MASCIIIKGAEILEASAEEDDDNRELQLNKLERKRWTLLNKLVFQCRNSGTNEGGMMRNMVAILPMTKCIRW